MSCIQNNFITEKARRLGVVISILLALGGWIFLLKDLAGAIFFSVSAVLVLTLSLFNPKFLQIPAKLWLSFIDLLFFLISNVFLILLFFLIVTPIGLAGRMFGKDFLSQKIIYRTSNYWDKVPGSYWIAPNKRKANPMRW